MKAKKLYRPPENQILAPTVLTAAIARLDPGDRELVERVCARVIERFSRVAIGPVIAREIVAAIGRLIEEQDM